MPSGLLPRILLVDDDVEVLDALRRQLHGNFDVVVTQDPKDAIRLAVSQGPFAVVVSDLRMPDMDGVSLLYLIRKAAPETVRVLLTGDGDLDTAISAINQGNIFRYLTKPCPRGALLRALEESVEQFQRATAQEDVRKL